ncbi:MAG: hypothetical protein CVU56_08545 [Deltaproteobacteria bacterium HGW-Deltaproteobacteria-14]|jgi:hypothetical protein|nr:MAG: hypothetical protein CVU56_08545 [Deltaproteobacteria bacterium HGW-Deltaproteobacteria-14]
MIRRALWIGGATLVFMACGPMPGYMAPSERRAPDKSTRSSVEYTAPDDDESASDDRAGTDDEDEGRYAQPGDRPRATSTSPPTVLRDRSTPAMPPAPSESAPTVTREAPPVKAPTPASATPASSPSKLQVVPLDRADSYYLIDRERGLCFFIHKETSAKVDCAIIPEGRDVAQPTPAATPAPKSDEGVRRRYVEPEPAPAAPPRRVTAPAPTPAPDPNGPTADELNRFESAYVEIACDRRQGSFTPPHARIDEAGLSQERYNAIEGWLTSDERAWRLLVNRAYRECDARK